MKTILLIFIFYFTGFSGSFVEPERWLVTEDSRLEIAGSSNINNFQCLAQSYAGNDTLYERWSPENKAEVLNGEISLEAESFDCQNRMITRDFKQTIQAGKFQDIKVRFISLEKKAHSAQPQVVKGKVEITLAGTSRYYDILCQLTQIENNKARLSGHKTVRLSDFDLTARPKFMGMIKVDDEVSVNFDLIIRPI